MKASLNAGHTHRAPGASGHIDEVAEDRKVRAALDKYLRAAGWSTHDSTTEEPNSDADLATICRLANASGADRFVSVHFNSGGGKGGVEVYYSPTSSSSWGREMATKISAALSKLMGIPNRGGKAKNFYVLKHTAMPAILIEVCFVDSATDAAAYRRVGPDAVGKCIAECIAGKAVAGSAPAPAPTPSKPSPAPSKGGLAVDGYWGRDTSATLQRYLHCVADGEIWGQYSGNRQWLPNCTGGWKWSANPSGSPVVKALQARLGVTADGIMGKNTVCALQRRLDVYPDGVCGPKTVRALQTVLNDGTL